MISGDGEYSSVSFGFSSANSFGFGAAISLSLLLKSGALPDETSSTGLGFSSLTSFTTTFSFAIERTANSSSSFLSARLPDFQSGSVQSGFAEANSSSFISCHCESCVFLQ